MSRTACFFSNSSPAQIEREQYAINDIRILKESGFNVVIATSFGDIPYGCDLYFGWWASGSILPLIKAKLSRRPIIVIAGGNESQFYKDSVSGQPYGYLNMPVHKKISTRLTLRFADRIIAVSDYMRHDIVRLSGRDPLVIGNCVDSEMFSPGPADQKTLITTIARLDTDVVRLKRIDNFLHAAKIIISQFPHQKFCIIGHKGDAFQRLSSLASDLGISQNIQFLGSIANARIRDWLRNSLVYVQVSDIETFGVAVAEAMATATPVVVSGKGALPHLVEDPICIVDHNSPPSIAGGILRLLQLDPEMRQQLGAEFRDKIVSRFSFNRRKSSIQKVIAEVCP